MNRRELEDLYNCRTKKVQCISVLYKNDVPVLYSINGDDSDLADNAVIKPVRDYVAKILGCNIDARKSAATITDSFSIFNPFERCIGDVENNREEKPTHKTFLDYTNALRILTHETMNYIQYESVKNTICNGNEKRFFTCSERKIIGRITKFSINFYKLRQDIIELASVEKPCVLCEPAMPFAYFLDDSSGTPLLKKQHVEIVRYSPCLEYRLYTKII